MASASLRIKDGGTERVGFKAVDGYRAEIEMVRRPFAGFTASFEWARVQKLQDAGKDPTPAMCEQIIERCAELKISGETWLLTPESLRELRAREFEAVIFCVHGRLDPDYLLVTNPDDASEMMQVPYVVDEVREGN